MRASLGLKMVRKARPSAARHDEPDPAREVDRVLVTAGPVDASVAGDRGLPDVLQPNQPPHQQQREQHQGGGEGAAGGHDLAGGLERRVCGRRPGAPCRRAAAAEAGRPAPAAGARRGRRCRHRAAGRGPPGLGVVTHLLVEHPLVQRGVGDGHRVLLVAGAVSACGLAQRARRTRPGDRGSTAARSRLDRRRLRRARRVARAGPTPRRNHRWRRIGSAVMRDSTTSWRLK